MKVKTVALQMSFTDNNEMLKTYVSANKVHRTKMVWLVRSKFRYHQMCGSLLDKESVY